MEILNENIKGQVNFMQEYPKLSDQFRIKRLESQPDKIRMVLDTDTFNEVDDQFALAYAIRSEERIKLEAIYAAPFKNERSSSPGEGMELSYAEIKKVLGILKNESINVFRGSTDFLESMEKPKENEAVQDLIRRAKTAENENPLYVVAIGAITNVASAILLEPKIIERIVVVWLGGNALFWHNTKEFNLFQDIIAARTIFDCGVPLVHIPCAGVTTHLHTTIAELEEYLNRKSEIGAYLTEIVRQYAVSPYAWSKVIWDIAPIAWLINPDWVPGNYVHSPIVTDQFTWSFDQSRHLIKSAYFVKRDHIFGDLFRKLSK